MSSTRKSRIANKRSSKVNEESPDKDGGSANKSRLRKRKLSDMLGSQWSKEELERFYEAYRKYGKDWKKVSSVIRNRSVDMVEALYSMNRAYLSLPEGTASVAGLIAMMTDHYNILAVNWQEGSDSERESNDGLGVSRKPQRRGRGKFRLNNSKGSDGPVPDLLQYQSAPSSYGYLPLLKKRRSGGSRPRAVGKRTPRIPVSYPYDKGDREKIVSLNRRSVKSEVDADDDEGAHVAALALAEASQRGGSPQVSRTPSRKTENTRHSTIQNGQMKQVESELANAKVIGSTIEEDWCEGSIGSREAENGDFSRDTSYPLDAETKSFKGKKPRVQAIENNHFDDVREACSGTEEGLTLRAVKDEVQIEDTDGRNECSSPQGLRKRSRQLFFGDESSALDALQTLADLSVHILLPKSAVDSESSVQVNEEKKDVNIVEKPNGPKTSAHKDRGHPSMAGVDILSLKNTKLGKDSSLDVTDISEQKQRTYQPTNKMQKRKRKSPATKIPKAEGHSDSRLSESHKNEVSAEEGRKPMSKEKRVNQIVPSPKQGKPVRPAERSSCTDLGRTGIDLAESNVQASTTIQVNLPTKLRSRRKKGLQKTLDRKELRPFENVGSERPNRFPHSVYDRALDFKDKLSHCLPSQMLRRWCAFEWFYSAIDHPWFAKREFVEYLNHARLGHIPRLTRVEWGVIRGSLGKPRRLSKQFLREEREKLEKYREDVRTHYAELRTGAREGLATDLPRPLSVGQRVIAIHPCTRELHDGSVLTVDRNKCRVQFDLTELGSEIVMDTECMPLNPLENMSEALRRQNVAVDKFHENFNDPKLHSVPKDWKIGGSMKFTSSENLENGDVLSHLASSNHPMVTLMKQAKGDTIDSVVQAKATANEMIAAQATYGQPCTLAQIQAKEADIRALSEVTRALDRKEALLIEIRNLNDEGVSGNLKDGDLEHFRKYYATVVVQLKEASEQVGSALLALRQRNTYQGNSMPSSVSRPMGNSGGTVGPLSSFDRSAFLTQDSGSQVVEILDSSRRRARTMVDAAMQAMSLLKQGEDAFVRIGEAIDSANNRYFGAGNGGVSAMRSHTSPEPGHGSSIYQDQATSCTSEPTIAIHAPSPNQNDFADGTEAQFPSELISSCVATLLMIQTCTERQYPPAEVAQILDSAVTSLQPCCSQNLPIYREIQLCMGIVKNQILALIPTQSNILPTELSTI
ncbi:protein ALWAYS EARLY 3-like isoform X2 [Tasmannia lanceolata]|uniref:protein ALWAYS EARLY 3-like isoform X2 n=1 Tax=Tasmannia lanceolata TaxID=3420 RepID=UPI0040640C13